MEITELSSQIIKKSEKFAELMSVCYTLLRHAPEAEAARLELKTRVPSYTVAGFVLGYFPEDERLNLLIDMMGLKALKELGVVYERRIFTDGIHETKLVGTLSKHNIIMPYKYAYGDIVGVVGRTLLPKQEQILQKVPKYKNSSLPKALNLFGMYNAKSHILAKDAVIIVEGQFDCITCHRYGFRNVVALGGASFSKYHFYLLKRYTNNIYLLLDNDEAGQRERNKIIAKHGNDANIQTITLDSRYKDIDEYLIKSRDHSLLSV